VVERLLQDNRIDPAVLDNLAIKIAAEKSYVTIVSALFKHLKLSHSASIPGLLQDSIIKKFLVSHPGSLLDDTKQQIIDTEQNEVPVFNENTQPQSNCNISMMCLGGVIAALGVAAVALAFTVLNAVTGGLAGVMVASAGVATALGGVGIFATGVKSNRLPTTEITVKEYQQDDNNVPTMQP